MVKKAETHCRKMERHWRFPVCNKSLCTMIFRLQTEEAIKWKKSFFGSEQKWCKFLLLRFSTCLCIPHYGITPQKSSRSKEKGIQHFTSRYIHKKKEKEENFTGHLIVLFLDAASRTTDRNFLIEWFPIKTFWTETKDDRLPDSSGVTLPCHVGNWRLHFMY